METAKANKFNNNFKLNSSGSNFLFYISNIEHILLFYVGCKVKHRSKPKNPRKAVSEEPK